jgi:acetylserotonin N-methyltransferase
MHHDLTPANPGPVLDLLNAFRKSQVMFTAVELGLFDQLAAGPKSCQELAKLLQVNANALERLLGALVMLQLLDRESDGRWANTPTARAYLTSASPDRFLGYINYSNAVLWRMWDSLPDAIREGTNRWKQTFGSDGPIFSHFFRTEEAKREFLFGMHGYGLISSPQVVNALDLSSYRTFVDLGGATGHLAVAACRRYPHLQGIVFDLPEVVELTREVVQGTDVAHRVTIVPGDFFADPLPSGDLYALGRILHDWTEPKIRRLLERIYSALPSGGAVLIAEKVLHEDKAGPEWAVLQSLNMLVCTEGQERTLSEYAQLLAEAGFQKVVCHRTASPLDVVLATK